MAVLGLSLLAAFSLSLAGVETLSHLQAEPWKLPVLLVLLLLVPLIQRERPREPAGTRFHWVSGAWIAAAVVVQGLSAAVDWPTGHRLALGLGGVGLLRMTRLLSLPSCLLCAMAVPPPTVLAKWSHPTVGSTLAWLSAHWMPQGTYLPGMAGSFPVPLQASDGGLAALWVAAAVLLYAVLSGRSRGRGLGVTLRETAWLGVIGFGVVLFSQLIGLAGAAWLAGPLGQTFARGFVDFVPACLVLMVGYWAVETAPARREPDAVLPLQVGRPGTTS